MADVIDNMASEIWKALGERGSVRLMSLPKMFSNKPEIVFQGLRRLFRENKVRYSQKDGELYVFLTSTENMIHSELR